MRLVPRGCPTGVHAHMLCQPPPHRAPAHHPPMQASMPRGQGSSKKRCELQTLGPQAALRPQLQRNAAGQQRWLPLVRHVASWPAAGEGWVAAARGILGGGSRTGSKCKCRAPASCSTVAVSFRFLAGRPVYVVCMLPRPGPGRLQQNMRGRRRPQALLAGGSDRYR